MSRSHLIPIIAAGVFFAASAVHGSPPAQGTAPTHSKPEHAGRGPHFHDPEESARRWDSPSRKKWQRPDEVIALLDVQPGDTVADIGTGTGYFLPFLSKAAGSEGRVIAIDVEQAMADYVVKRVQREELANVQVRRARHDNPGFTALEANRILIVNTWHHIEDREAYAALLHDALNSCERPGAVLVIDYTMESPEGPPKKIRLRPKTVIKELQAGGLEPTLLKENLPRQYAVKAVRKDRPSNCPAPACTKCGEGR